MNKWILYGRFESEIKSDHGKVWRMMIDLKKNCFVRIRVIRVIRI